MWNCTPVLDVVNLRPFIILSRIDVTNDFVDHAKLDSLDGVLITSQMKIWDWMKLNCLD